MAYFHTTVLDNQIKALPTVDTASGSVATFDTDMTENLVSVIAEISASATKCYIANISDITNISWFQGLINGTHTFYKFTGSESWTYSSANNFFYVDLNFYSTNYGKNNSRPLNSNGIQTFIVNNEVVRVYLSQNPSITSDTDMNTVFTSDSYMIYELATPRTSTITKAEFETLLNAFDLSGWLFEYDFGETVSSGATIECVSGTLTRNDDSIKSVGGNILSVLSDNNIFASTGDVEVKYILSVGKAIS